MESGLSKRSVGREGCIEDWCQDRGGHTRRKPSSSFKQVKASLARGDFEDKETQIDRHPPLFQPVTPSPTLFPCSLSILFQSRKISYFLTIALVLVPDYASSWVEEFHNIVDFPSRLFVQLISKEITISPRGYSGFDCGLGMEPWAILPPCWQVSIMVRNYSMPVYHSVIFFIFQSELNFRRNLFHCQLFNIYIEQACYPRYKHKYSIYVLL